jgi:hypothetical protein
MAENGRPITTEQATVQTVTIAVRTLTLGKRQLTLSVFRQLVREQIVDPETLALRGEAWGLVNYFPASCPDEFAGKTSDGYTIPLDEHLHVVWQRDGLLRRACVGPHGPIPLYRRRLKEAADRHTDYAVPVVLTALLQGRLTGVERKRTPGGQEHITLAAAGLRLTLHSWEDWPIGFYQAESLLQGTPYAEPTNPPPPPGPRDPDSVSVQAAVERVRHQLASLGCKGLAGRDPREPAFAEELGGRVDDVRARRAAARERLAWAETEWPPVYQQLQALDQLFIAV